MGVSPINSGSGLPQTDSASSSKTQTSSGTTGSASSSSKDSAVISQKAKDLAAQQQGKSMQEEMSESVAAKQAEGDNS